MASADAWRTCAFCGRPIDCGVLIRGGVGMHYGPTGVFLVPFCGDHLDDASDVIGSLGGDTEHGSIIFEAAMPEFLAGVDAIGLEVWTYGRG